MSEILTQLKSSPNFVLNKFYSTNKKAVLGNSVEVTIKRGASVVLESVSPVAEHLVQKTSDAYILSVALPRFPLKSKITAADISLFKSIDNRGAIQEAITTKIADILAEHKNSIDTTLEFMAVGSLFGKILDGKGNLLFDFVSKNEEIKCTSKKVIQILNDIDTSFIKEYGKNTPYEVLCGYEFLQKLVDKATSEKLFESLAARWESNAGSRVLLIHGTRFIPYSAKYKNLQGEEKDFLESKKAIAVPMDASSFALYYGRAVHTSALNLAPKLYFSASPELLPDGGGYSIISETRAIPICNRPDGIIHLSFE